MAQLEAARAQQAAEAASIGLTLDEEKITSASAATRRHLQGLALVVQVSTRSLAGRSRAACLSLLSWYMQWCVLVARLPLFATRRAASATHLNLHTSLLFGAIIKSS